MYDEKEDNIFLSEKLKSICEKLSSIKYYELNQYCHSGSSRLDKRCFLRSKVQKEKYRDLRNLTSWDTDINTGYDFNFAKVITFNMLSEYLKTELIMPTLNVMEILFHGNNQHKKFRWTGKKIDLVELGYFIKFTNCINSGNVDTKDIMHVLGRIFGYDLRDYADIIGAIKERKISRLKLCEETMQKFNEYLNDEGNQKTSTFRRN